MLKDVVQKAIYFFFYFLKKGLFSCATIILNYFSHTFDDLRITEMSPIKRKELIF